MPIWLPGKTVSVAQVPKAARRSVKAYRDMPQPDQKMVLYEVGVYQFNGPKYDLDEDREKGESTACGLSFTRPLQKYRLLVHNTA